MLSSMYTVTKTCKVVPKIITKVRLDFRDDISIWSHPLLAGSPRHLCSRGTSQTEDKHVPRKNLAQTKKEQGWCYDPTIKYEALRQCAVPRPAHYAESATDWSDADSEIEIETMTEEEAQVQKDKILAEAKEEQPFPYKPHRNYEIIKQFWYIDSPDSLTYSNLILASDPKEELQAKQDLFREAMKQVYSKTNDTKTEVKILADTETEPETKTEIMAEEEAHEKRILAGAKDEHLYCYDPSIKYEPLKRYIIPRFAFFDSSSTDWSDSSSFSDSETETETMAKREAQSQEDKILERETTLSG